jgi:hypothetical protein
LRDYAAAIYPDEGAPDGDFAAAAAAFENCRRRGDTSGDHEELAFQLVQHFFPDQLQYMGRVGFGMAFHDAAMRGGVVIAGPALTDCIAFAARLLAQRRSV